MRRTKIVATVGPASDSPEVLDDLMAAGVDVFRLNAAHSGPSELGERLRAVRDASARAGREVGVLLDLPGPKLRIGEMQPGTVLVKDSPFALVVEDCVGDATKACVNYRSLADDLHEGDRVLIDDGRIALEVVRTSSGRVDTRVLNGGPLPSRKGINIPDVTLAVDSVTPFDRTIMAWGIANGVDFIGQSFVRSATDIDVLREYMVERQLPIVAKIEKHEAAGRIAAIVAAADAVMVARGDLGAETAPEQVPVLQREIVETARAAGKPVIIATQMLESMTASPRPTRAEASDVATAIFQGADAVMLSAETATGEYPVEAVRTMARIASTSEAAVRFESSVRSSGSEDDVQAAMSAAVVDLGDHLRLAWIVTPTQSGATARAVARHRPRSPVVAVTPHTSVARNLSLVWGVKPMLQPLAANTDEMVDSVMSALRDQELIAHGERVAITAGRATREPGGTDLIMVQDA